MQLFGKIPTVERNLHKHHLKPHRFKSCGVDDNVRMSILKVQSLGQLYDATS